MKRIGAFWGSFRAELPVVGSEFLVLFLAVLLAILPACPSGGKPPTGPPTGPGPLNIADQSHFRQSVGSELLSARFDISDGNFPNQVVPGFIPNGTKIWYVPAAMVNNLPADVSFKEMEVVYRTIYGATFTYRFEVEKVPESQGGGYRIIGDADLLAAVAVGATATTIIVAGVTLDIIQCAVVGWGFLLWPLGCFPGPFRLSDLVETDGFDIGPPAPVVYDWELTEEKSADKSLSVPPKGWVEILLSNNLFSIDVSAVYTVHHSSGNVDKFWGGRFSFDTDEDGFTNEEEVTAGTDPYDPNDFPMPIGLPLELSMATVPNELSVGEPATSTLSFGGSLPPWQFELNWPDGTAVNGRMLDGGEIILTSSVGTFEVSGTFGSTGSALSIRHHPIAPTDGFLPVRGRVVGSDGQSKAVENPVKVNPAGPPPPQSVAVPNVVGLLRSTAESTIHNAGLSVGVVTTSHHATVPVGKVISSAPVAGTQVALGSSVNLIISLGPEPPATAPVPNVVGLTQSSAESTIHNAGFSVGTVTTSYHATVPVGKVISSSPVAGTQVLLGSNVDFVVSLGPVSVPPLTLSFISTDADTTYLVGESGNFRATVGGGTPPYSVVVLYPDASAPDIMSGAGPVFNFASHIWAASTGGVSLPVQCRATDSAGRVANAAVYIRIN